MKDFTKVKTLAAALALCALSLAAVGPAASGQLRPPVRHDAARLRRALAAALGGEFEIVRDELTRRSTYYGGGAYWLVHVKPRRSGSFLLKYTYRYEDTFTKSDERETRVEHRIALGVGPRGCWRRPQHMASYSHPCLGDTIILPFAVDAYKKDYSGHTFEFAVNSITPPGAAAGPEKWQEKLIEQEDSKMLKDAVANPLAEHLKYLGSALHVSPHRALGFTANYYATFEAVKPGSFNLSLGASLSGAARVGVPRGGGIPIVVVERGTPVTWLAAKEDVSEYVGRFSSHTGNGYLTTPVIMQPGERLTLLYLTFSRRGQDPGKGDIENQVPPVIGRLPFYVDPDDQYNEWVVEHLPARSPRKAP